jgi:LPXTG-site transpeptidase (sortase) family protein
MYDADGNIILPFEEEIVETPMEQSVTEEPETVVMEERIEATTQSEEIPAWVTELEISREDLLEKEKVTFMPKNRAIKTPPTKELQKALRSLALESSTQYKTSMQDVSGVFTSAGQGLGGFLRGFKAFLLQPVWIITPKKAPRKYSRVTLFTLDVVRFGGTFALIFGGLFSALNYESFWQILEEKIDPLSTAQAVQEQTTAIDTQLKEKLLRSPALATAGEHEGSLLAALPPVGPPENRLIIPKLGLNIPLVTPSYASLLAEDWTKVEEDIQQALEQGVVHYPGTARPGQAGNFFVTGHSSYYPWASGNYKTVFARLHNLEPGDEYYVYYGGDQHRYIVRSKKEVSPSDVGVLDQPINKRLATLMTCTPVGTTLRRLILVAEEIDPVSGEAMEVGEHTQRPDSELNLEMLPI